MITRRDASWLIAKAAATSGALEFLGPWLASAEHMHAPRDSQAPPDPHDWPAYRPRFFTVEEMRNIETFSEILIPSDDTPGAREAHVAPFIDFVVEAAHEYAPEMQQHWRDAAGYLSKQNFATLSGPHQHALVQRLSEGEGDPSRTDPGTITYRLIKDMTVHAFYTSRPGLIDALEYKGLAYLAQFPGCTHPEHHGD